MRERINGFVMSPYGFSIGLAILIVASIWVPPLIFVAVLLNAVAFVKFDESDAFRILFFVMPFAAIYKYPGVATSFLTVLEVLLVLIVIYRRRKINAHTVVVILLITTYFVLRMGTYYMGIVKLLLAFMLVYSFTSTCRREDAPGLVEFMAFGTLISSILGFFKETIPALSGYFEDTNYEFIDGERTLRFSGLYVDPNFFSVVLITIMAVLILMKRYMGYKPLKFWILFASMATLGFLTYSKSFVLMFALVLLFEVFINAPKRRPLFTAIELVLIAALILLFFSGRVAVFERMFTRLEDEDVLTGRDVIWANYLESILSSFKNTAFGAGLDAEYVGTKSSHNMYIELMHYSGIAGMLAYMAGWMYLIVTEHKRRLSLAPVVVPLFVFIMYFFICGFLDHTLPFMVMLSWLSFEVAGGSRIFQRIKK